MKKFYTKKGVFTRNDSWTEQGAAAVEFALILPILILFLFGIMELSMLLFDLGMVSHSVRVGARTASLYKASYSPVKNIDSAEQEAGPLCQDCLLNFSGTYYEVDPYLAFFTIGGTAITTQAEFDAVGSGDPYVVRLNQDYPYSFLVLSSFIGLGPRGLNNTILVRKE